MTDAAKNRELMPNVAKMVDEWREHFPGLKVVWAKDLVTGHEAGKRRDPDPDKVFTIPEGYYPTQQIETKKGKKR